MKNVNFQYATKLWDYLQQHIDDDTIRDKKDETIKDEVKTKEYMDELFLISYLTINDLDKNKPQMVKEEIQEKLASTMVERLIDLNDELTQEKLQELIANQFSKIKIKKTASEKEIENKFKDSINKYLDRIKKVKM